MPPFRFLVSGGVRYRVGRGTRPRKFVFKAWGTWHRLCSGGGGGGVNTSAHFHLKSSPQWLLQVDYNFTANSLQVLAPSPSDHGIFNEACLSAP